MDAKVDDWVVTPRRGKPVEINALWHNALCLLEAWLVRAGRGVLSAGIARDARRCKESFNRRFWNPARGYLNDVVDGENGDDDACRPNQVVAIAVGRSPLEPKFWKPVVEHVAAELLTPFGLRTLSPQHKDYKSKYFGDLRARDAAYHQGTVWPWLPTVVDAWIAVHPECRRRAWPSRRPAPRDRWRVRRRAERIFDAVTPFTPRCFAQAWSVADCRVLLLNSRVFDRAVSPSDAYSCYVGSEHADPRFSQNVASNRVHMDSSTTPTSTINVSAPTDLVSPTNAAFARTPITKCPTVADAAAAHFGGLISECRQCRNLVAEHFLAPRARIHTPIAKTQLIEGPAASMKTRQPAWGVSHRPCRANRRLAHQWVATGTSLILHAAWFGAGSHQPRRLPFITPFDLTRSSC